MARSDSALAVDSFPRLALKPRQWPLLGQRAALDQRLAVQWSPSRKREPRLRGEAGFSKTTAEESGETRATALF
jgi:hypothetical protein